MTEIKWKIGCSGFHYTEWKGIFTPKQFRKRWAKFYAERFHTLDLTVKIKVFLSHVAVLKTKRNDSAILTSFLSARVSSS